MTSSSNSSSNSSRVPTGLYARTRLSRILWPFWPTFSKLESFFVADEIAEREISRPVYVTGIARAGTTIVTEMLAASPQLTSHQYADFPFLFTPYWRNYLAQRSQVAEPATVERAHKDRIRVSSASPEAFEEVLWMLFDPALHYKKPVTPVAAGQEPAGFRAFYVDHIRKLLAVRSASRYLAKGNYNLLRVPWLTDALPDPRIVLMVRHPVWHVASLIKQHRLFVAAQQVDARTGWQLAASGHFEFGPLRRAAAYLGLEAQQAVSDLWESGDEVRGWARLWAQGYSLALDYLANAQLSPHLLLVRYEDLCGQPEATIDRIAAFCGLGNFESVRNQYAPRLKPPQYYAPDFTPAEKEAIAEETGATAAALGY